MEKEFLQVVYYDDEDGQKNPYTFDGSYSIAKWPTPVGYWVLYPEAPTTLKYSVYKKPLRIQIWFTEKLLGWGWEDA